MTIREYLVDAGYEAAGVTLENESLNQVATLLKGKELSKQLVTAAYKYAVLDEKMGTKLGNRGFETADTYYYSNWFFKI